MTSGLSSRKASKGCLLPPDAHELLVVVKDCWANETIGRLGCLQRSVSAESGGSPANSRARPRKYLESQPKVEDQHLGPSKLPPDTCVVVFLSKYDA